MTRGSKLTFVFDISATNVINYYNTEINLGGLSTPSGSGFAPLSPQTLGEPSQKRVAVRCNLHGEGSDDTPFTVTGSVDNYTLTAGV
jgi:hypothetical protein